LYNLILPISIDISETPSSLGRAIAARVFHTWALERQESTSVYIYIYIYTSNSASLPVLSHPSADQLCNKIRIAWPTQKENHTNVRRCSSTRMSGDTGKSSRYLRNSIVPLSSSCDSTNSGSCSEEPSRGETCQQSVWFIMCVCVWSFVLNVLFVCVGLWNFSLT
jgi:hypothetical protein